MTETERPVDVLVTHLPKTHQIRVTWRPDLKTTVSPTGIEGARWLHDGRGWTVPALGAHVLLPYFSQNFPQLRISFDIGSATLIHEQISREAATATLATAEDGDVPDVLSIKLRPFQRAALAYLLRGTPRKVVALDTGLGKTAVACAYARIRQARTLWVTSSSLVNNLRREIQKLTGQRALAVLGTAPSTQAIEAMQDRSIQHIIITYDALSRSLVEDQDAGLLSSMWALAISVSPFDLLIVDEAHFIRNRATARWKVVSLLKSIPSILLLTATPLVNSGLNFYSLLTLLDDQTFGSPAEFTRAYLSYDGKLVLNPKRLQSDLLPYMFRRRKMDVLKDLPAKIRHTHTIELTGEHARRYADVLTGIYEDMKGDIHDVPDSILAKMNRFRQVASAAKVSHTVELAMTLEESGEKCLVFTAWKDSAHALAKELSCGVITGDISKDESTRLQDDFNDNPSTRHLVIMIQCGQVGLNLTGASAVIFNDYVWNFADHSQAEDRAYGRLNDPHGCLCYYVAVDNSVDEHLMKILSRKEELERVGVDGAVVRAQETVSLTREFLSYLRLHQG